MRHAGWWLLAASTLLGACFSPSYESGKTACSPAGECPPGFECIARLCYKPGEGPAPDLGVPDLAGGGMPDMVPPGDLFMVDMTPTVTIVPPASVWTSAGGGGGKAASQNQLNFTVGGTVSIGTSAATSGASIEFGQFPAGTVE